jgi:hypothetical protein
MTVYTPDMIRGTQIRTHAGFSMPSGFNAQVGVNIQLSGSGISSIKGTLESGKGTQNVDTLGTLFANGAPSLEDALDQWGGFSWDIGFGYSDFLAKDGLEYTGSLDLDKEGTV